MYRIQLSALFYRGVPNNPRCANRTNWIGYANPKLQAHFALAAILQIAKHTKDTNRQSQSVSFLNLFGCQSHSLLLPSNRYSIILDALIKIISDRMYFDSIRLNCKFCKLDAI